MKNELNLETEVKIGVRGNNRKSIARNKKLPQFTTMNVIDGQAGLVNYSSLIFYSLTIDNILNIIVLLILAGVSISMLTGENGILTQAQRAKEETEKAQANEVSDLANIESLINEYQTNINIPQVIDENPGQLEQEGTDTFVINSIEDLVFFSHDVTNGNNYSGKTVKLGVNLDFNSNKSYVNPNSTDYEKYGYSGPLKQALTSGTGFSPIGSQDGTNSFYGTFDGNNNAICSLYININTNKEAIVGFFQTNYGEIKNLGLVNVNITAITQDNESASVGGIARKNYNKISNSYVTGDIKTEGSSWQPVGGICGSLGSNESSIENCYNLANIESKNIQKEKGDSNISCGGILGQTDNGGIINKCFNKGNIYVDGGVNVIYLGGICGNLGAGNVENSYNNAKIECTSKNYVYVSEGGIVGYFGYLQQGATIENCYNSGEISGNEVNKIEIGGIVGCQFPKTSINNVYNNGKIMINSEGNLIAGGISGKLNGNCIIDNTYNIGILEVKNAIDINNVGSIIGVNINNITLSNCYYLKGTYDVGAGGDGTVTEIKELENISEFPSVLEVVNGDDAFEEDSGNVNGGYPVLKMD